MTGKTNARHMSDPKNQDGATYQTGTCSWSAQREKGQRDGGPIRFEALGPIWERPDASTWALGEDTRRAEAGARSRGGGGERRRGKGWRGQDKKKLKKAPRDQKREWEDGEHDKEEGVRVKEDG